MPLPTPDQTSIDAMTQATREAAGVWESAFGIWGNYFTALAANATPQGIFEANAQLMTDSLEVYGRAAGMVLRDGGLKTPTLNDA